MPLSLFCALSQVAMRTEGARVFGFDGAAHQQSAEDAVRSLEDLRRYKQSEPRFSFLGRLHLICVCHHFQIICLKLWQFLMLLKYCSRVW